MEELTRRGGNRTTYDEDWLAAGLERRIAAGFDKLRFEQALRTVMIASPEVLPAAPPAPATAAEG